LSEALQASQFKVVADELDAEQSTGTVELSRGRRARAAASVPRELFRIAHRDPEHLCERMTLFASRRLGESSREWLLKTRESHPESEPLEIALQVGSQSARIARTEGAVAGTPFYLALVPGYLNYLWQEIRMTMRLAALYGRDPAALRTAAEVLALRGIYPSVEAAHAGLLEVQAAKLPPKPERRRPLRLWVQSVRRLLVFGGFISPPRATPRQSKWSWMRDAAGLLAGAGVWVVTWFFPLTFMIAMAWGCHSHSRRLFKDALAHYAGEKVPRKSARERMLGLRHHTPRELAQGAALGVSILVPVGFLVYATYVRNHVGLNAISGLGLLVAVSLVLAVGVYGARR
jgi:hypothetical protein